MDDLSVTNGKKNWSNFEIWIANFYFPKKTTGLTRENRAKNFTATPIIDEVIDLPVEEEW